MDVTRSPPSTCSVTTASLSNVQDINIRMKGIFNTMLNFGDVICQTASSGSKTFALIGVANPKKVLDVIDEARCKAKAAGWPAGQVVPATQDGQRTGEAAA